MGLASLARNAPSGWTVPYLLSFTEKFQIRNTFAHKSVRKWSACSILKTLQEKERVDPFVWFPEQTINFIWQNASSPMSTKTSFSWWMHNKTNITCAWRTINSVKDAVWSARNLLVFQSKELTLSECCRLAHSKVQDYLP
eukprot:g31364.t1